MNSLKKNFIYNIIYNISILIIPLIVAPYLARVIGADGVGTYSYTYSIAQYFVLFGILGLQNYGNRAIAKVRDDKEKLQKEFSSIYMMQFVSSMIIIFAYIIFIAIINEYKIYFMAQSFYVISCLFDINWLFFGLEKFKITVSRNMIIKIISTICIFVFVKSKSDIVIYILILSISTLISQLVLWTFLKKYTKLDVREIKNIKRHIIPNLKLFIPVIAISLYNIMDKIMLGTITQTTKEVGFYENAEKIIQIPVTIFNALGTVMLPRVSNLCANGEDNKIEKYLSKSIELVMFFSAAMVAGLFAVADRFCIFYFGSEFQMAGVLLQVLCCVILFKSWANVIRTQYLIPKEKDKIYIISICSGAIINLIFNMLLIPKLYGVGACIGTILAEFVVMFIQSFAIRNELPVGKYLKGVFPFFVKAGIMLIVIYPINYLHLNSLLILFIQVALGAGVYGLLNYRYIVDVIDLKKIVSKFKKKL